MGKKLYVDDISYDLNNYLLVIVEGNKKSYVHMM